MPEGEFAAFNDDLSNSGRSNVYKSSAKEEYYSKKDKDSDVSSDVTYEGSKYTNKVILDKNTKFVYERVAKINLQADEKSEKEAEKFFEKNENGQAKGYVALLEQESQKRKSGEWSSYVEERNNSVELNNSIGEWV